MYLGSDAVEYPGYIESTFHFRPDHAVMVIYSLPLGVQFTNHRTHRLIADPAHTVSRKTALSLSNWIIPSHMDVVQ